MSRTLGREAVMLDGREVGSIYLRGVRWYMDYRPTSCPEDRKQFPIKTSDGRSVIDRREAARLAEDYAVQHADDKRGGIVLSPKKGMTLSEALEDYETDRVTLGYWRESSRERNMFTLEAFIDDMGKDKPVAVVTEERIDAWIKAHIKKGNNSLGTCLSDFSRVRAFIYWLARKKYLTHRLDLSEMGPSKEQATSEAEKRSLSPDEVDKVVGHLAKREDPYWSEWLTVALATGMRPGEQAHLRGQDYDADKKTIIIRAWGDWKPKTKNGGRPLPVGRVSPEAAAILAARKLKAGPDGLLFPSLGRGGSKPEVDKPWRRESLHHALATACAGSKVDVMPYGLRHTFARRAVAAGWKSNFLRQWMGHSSVTTTEGYYKEIGIVEYDDVPVLAPVKVKAAQ